MFTLTFEPVWLDLVSVSPKYPCSVEEITALKITHFLPLCERFSLLYCNLQHVLRHAEICDGNIKTDMNAARMEKFMCEAEAAEEMISKG